MDVEAAAALVAAAGTAVGTGAASAAGESAWQSLVSLARRATGRAPGGQEDAADPGGRVPDGDVSDGEALDGVVDGEVLDAPDAATAREFAARLRQRADQDAEFAARLCEWAETHRATIEATQLRDESVVENKIVGSRVTGPVIQARDIHGGITLN
ncbi:hypothetical protein GCM10009801_32930 [Streptomyces albiaxialis]|uniref:Uncharacterized protein n=1 Tax=Streptomyces albiaxialis TaxID=329523 RepID=A0ABN2VXY8_9ACTN